MSAARQALASMLDELMGKHRNILPSEKPPDIGFEDSEVCKYFLAGFCHHDLFTNTKADLGPCGKTHDEKLREDYRSSEKFGKLGYEEEWLTALQRVHNDMQRKILRNKQRLELTQPGGKVEDMNKDTVEQKIDSLSEKITALLQQAETLGSQGRVDEAQKLIERTEELKEERDRCKKTVELPVTDLKAMEVCDTCGCFLILGDSQHRIDEHLTGKQHLGFSKINATIEELLARREEERRQSAELRKKTDEHRQDSSDRRREHHDRHDRRRSRSRSPGKNSGYSRSRHSPRRYSDDRHRHGYGDTRRHYRSNYEPSNRRQSSSRYDASHNDRYSSSYRRRSRSPVHQDTRSSREKDKLRSDSDVGRSSKREAESKISMPADRDNVSPDGHKVNSSKQMANNEHKGQVDSDEDEEGLIESSDE